MYRKNAIASAGLFFVFWMGILYAGADHPPPRKFILAIALVSICASVVYLRVPTYVGWLHSRKPRRHLYVVLDGLAAGLVLALLTAVAPGAGEPSVTPRNVDRIIWFNVLGAMGIGNSIAIYLANAVAIRMAGRVRKRI